MNGLAEHVGREISSITLVEPRTYFEAPNGVLGAIHHPDYRREFQVVAKNQEWAWDRRVKHVASRVASVDPAARTIKLENGEDIAYDVLCIATGTKSMPEGAAIWRPGTEIKTLEARLDEIERYRADIAKSKTIMLIGGGVVGVELVSELAERHPNVRIHFAVSDKELLISFPSITRRVARRHIERLRNVQIHFGTGRLGPPDADGVYRIGSFEIRPDMVIKCFPSGLNTGFLPDAWLDERKQVKVDRFLQVEGTSGVFALGDVANISNDKSAKTAIDEAEVVRRNVLAVCRSRQSSVRFNGARTGFVLRLGPRESLMYYLPFIGLYGITLSGSYLAAVVREILLARIIHQCSTGGTSGSLKGPSGDLAMTT